MKNTERTVNTYEEADSRQNACCPEGEQIQEPEKKEEASKKILQWHPAFCAAAELELIENFEELDFNPEHNLSKKPLEIDLLVIEKLDDVKIKNEIGHIFRKYNIIEYKSPGDGLTIDDFYKTVGYACFYKGQGQTVNQIPGDQITISLVREGCPDKMFCDLEELGFTVEKKADGIYYIGGFFIPAQVIVTRELEGTRHRSLRILSRNVLEEDVRGFTEEAKKYTEQGNRDRVDSILQVSVYANFAKFEEIKGRDTKMCDAMKELMKDEIDKAVEEADKNGEARGKAEGIAETLFNLVKDGILTIADAAKRANMSVIDFEKGYKTFLL